MKLLGIISVGVDVTDELLISFFFFFAFIRYWRINGSTMQQYISYSYTPRKPMIHLGGKYCTIISKSFGYPRI
jgi:hypothetical protein